MTTTDRDYMERDPMGYHYPAGTPGPRSESLTAYCETCGWEAPATLIRDLGTADLIVRGKAIEACPHCEYDAPPLRTRTTRYAERISAAAMAAACSEDPARIDEIQADYERPR